jgi:hypothetical protein
VLAPAEREAVMSAQHTAPKIGPNDFRARDPRLIVRIWFNDTVVYDSRTAGKTGAKPFDAAPLDEARGRQGKPFRIRKGVNTLVVGCQSGEDNPVDPGTISVRFNDAKDGKPMDGLVWDMEGR